MTKTTFESLARLQPMSYFKKYERILISNLLVRLHNANIERKRTDGDYSMTADLLDHVYSKRDLVELLFVGEVIAAKIRLRKKK